MSPASTSRNARAAAEVTEPKEEPVAEAAAETTAAPEPVAEKPDLAQMSGPAGENPFVTINDDGKGDVLEAAKVGSKGVLVRTRCAAGVAMAFVPDAGIQASGSGNRIS